MHRNHLHIVLRKLAGELLGDVPSQPVIRAQRIAKADDEYAHLFPIDLSLAAKA